MKYMIIVVIVFERLEDLLARSAERDPDALDAKSKQLCRCDCSNRVIFGGSFSMLEILADALSTQHPTRPLCARLTVLLSREYLSMQSASTFSFLF
jgi:hypothetical protein